MLADKVQMDKSFSYTPVNVCVDRQKDGHMDDQGETVIPTTIVGHGIQEKASTFNNLYTNIQYNRKLIITTIRKEQIL